MNVVIFAQFCGRDHGAKALPLPRNECEAGRTEDSKTGQLEEGRWGLDELRLPDPRIRLHRRKVQAPVRARFERGWGARYREMGNRSIRGSAQPDTKLLVFKFVYIDRWLAKPGHFSGGAALGATPHTHSLAIGLRSFDPSPWACSPFYNYG